jgi:DNA-binding winged helix-turn-helix (wHTH) protein/tetratricopeptide (TPR) repeat protein
VLSFAGFELDQQRAELRGPDGVAIRLRPKTFDLLILFVRSPGRILSKQELMEAVWPNIHVGEDSLFQCIRELRAALSDDQRQIVKLVSGRGYMFDAEVLTPPTPDGQKSPPAPEIAANPEASRIAVPRLGLRLGGSIAAAVGLAAIVGLAVATPIFKPDISVKQTPTVAVMPIAEANQDPDTAAVAAAVTDRLTDGLAKIDNIRVMAPNAGKQQNGVELASAPPAEADYVVRSELSRGQRSWTIRTRMVKTANGEVESIPALTVDDKDLDADLLHTRLAAGVGHLLAVRINALADADAKQAATDNPARQGSAKVVIEQATASIMQTSRERFAAAQTMLEKALSNDSDNVDLEVALAALQLRGIQMAWYSPDESIAAEKNAQLMLERALRVKPNNIPVLEAYCRFLNASNQFVESLVACARTLAFDPWDGMMLYHMGLAHIQLGRFEDALATFKQADRYDTPQVSRWTWLLGVGWSYVMMGRDAEALPWLERSIAITPASGRPLMLLAATYQRLGRIDEAKTTLAKALQVRPGSTVSNIKLPIKNSSPAFLAASDKIRDAMIAAGLPDR